MQSEITYTTPVVCQGKAGWFVRFDIKNEITGELKRIQKRGNINYYDGAARVKAAEVYRKQWLKTLESGWHPFAGSDHALVTPLTPLHSAIDFAFSKCVCSSATRKAYKGTVKFIKEAASRVAMDKFPVGQLEHQHILHLMDNISRHREWSNDAYNKHAGYLCAILSRLNEWKAIKINPAEKIKMKPVTEKQKYVPYTEEEKKKIRDHLYLHQYRFFVYLMTLYQTGIRPKEALLLKIKDINLSSGFITILPDLEEENSKTKSIRNVPISAVLQPYLVAMDLQEYPNEFYVFGSPFKPGEGRRGSLPKAQRGLHPNYFKPSPVKVKRDTVTKLWKKLIIDGLGINKHLYASKHTGADAKILAGVSVDALKTMYGHSSKLMTERYISVLKQMHAKEIRELSPEF